MFNWALIIIQIVTVKGILFHLLLIDFCFSSVYSKLSFCLMLLVLPLLCRLIILYLFLFYSALCVLLLHICN
jgi:hypothetical protein